MLNGKTVVVTGAARGLGRDIAIACGRHGAALILGDILEEQGLETVACLKADGVTARFVPRRSRRSRVRCFIRPQHRCE